MNPFLMISLIVFYISGLFSLVLQLQMLQQNSYFPSRYYKWLRANIPIKSAFFYLLASLCILFESYLLLSILSVLALILSIYEAVSSQKKSIKKLVFTGRVKRQFSVAIILIGAVNIVYSYFPFKAILFALLILDLLSPVLTFIIWLIANPIEKAFARYYINDAKKILKKHKSIKVIGITGSYGKTTTKFILNRILSEGFNVVCTPQSFNTPMGVVRTIRENLKNNTEIFICEMGAKNVGDIKEICDIVHPDIGVITSVGPQHLETFKTVDNVFKTKFELADAVKKKNGKVFVYLDSPEIKNRNINDYTTYGTENADFTAFDITYGKDGSKFKVKLGGEAVEFTSKLLGIHSIINITGAIGLAYTLGVRTDDIKYAVASLKPTEHRLEMKSSVNGSIMLDDAYNANPEGSLEAVRVLGSFDGMKKVIITPGLIELGTKEYECNKRLGLEAAEICDIIILVGENRSKPLADGVGETDFDKKNLYIAKSFFEAMDIYTKFADSNTVLLIENDLPDNYLN